MSRTISNDESGILWGMVLFFILMAIVGFMYMLTMPIFTAAEDGFDQEYRDNYVPESADTTINYLSMLQRYGLAILILFAGAIMVINRAIYRDGN